MLTFCDKLHGKHITKKLNHDQPNDFEIILISVSTFFFQPFIKSQVLRSDIDSIFYGEEDVEIDSEKDEKQILIV